MRIDVTCQYRQLDKSMSSEQHLEWVIPLVISGIFETSASFDHSTVKLFITDCFVAEIIGSAARYRAVRPSWRGISCFV